MYADDLAILASSREELQDKLNVLSVYCKDRNLNVNVNKSKVMVFNSIKNTKLFMYNNLSIDEVDSFKYLGMTFNRKANLKHSQRILIHQALKVKATLECHVNKHKYIPVRDIFDLCLGDRCCRNKPCPIHKTIRAEVNGYISAGLPS